MHDHHVEELLLLRQIALDFDDKRRVREEVDEEQAKEPVPVPQRIAFDGINRLMPTLFHRITSVPNSVAYGETEWLPYGIEVAVKWKLRRNVDVNPFALLLP